MLHAICQFEGVMRRKTAETGDFLMPFVCKAQQHQGAHACRSTSLLDKLFNSPTPLLIYQSCNRDFSLCFLQNALSVFPTYNVIGNTSME